MGQRNGWERRALLAKKEEEERLLIPEGVKSREVPQWEIRLIQRAIRQGWPISAEDRAKVIDNAMSIVNNSKSPKAVIAASKILVMADAANTNKEKVLLANELAIQKATGEITDQPATQVNVQVNVNNVTNALQEPEYLEFLRSKSLEEDCNAGTIRT